MSTFTSFADGTVERISPVDENHLYSPLAQLKKKTLSLSLSKRFLIASLMGSLLGSVGLQVANSQAPEARNQVLVEASVPTTPAIELIQSVRTENTNEKMLDVRKGNLLATNLRGALSSSPKGQKIARTNGATNLQGALTSSPTPINDAQKSLAVN